MLYGIFHYISLQCNLHVLCVLFHWLILTWWIQKILSEGKGLVMTTLTTFLVINVVHRVPYEPASRATGHIGSNCFPSGSASVFLRKPIGTCDFPGQEEGSGLLVSTPLNLIMNELYVVVLNYFSSNM